MEHEIDREIRDWEKTMGQLEIEIRDFKLEQVNCEIRDCRGEDNGA